MLGGGGGQVLFRIVSVQGLQLDEITSQIFESSLDSRM